MRDTLQTMLDGLADLIERVAGNEGRPSAEDICQVLTNIHGLGMELQRSPARGLPTLEPPIVTTAAPFQMGAPIVATHPRVLRMPEAGESTAQHTADPDKAGDAGDAGTAAAPGVAGSTI